MSERLVVDGVSSGYGDIEVLHGISLTVDQGEIVAVIGSNAAGKTTLQRTIMGFIPTTAGAITFGDTTLTGKKVHEIARLGVASVFGRDVFAPISVRANLLLAGRLVGTPRFEERIDEVHQLFPDLRKASARPAGQLSGGQQQMLALAMALISRPRITLLDEPSSGLSPKLVGDFLRIVEEARHMGTSFLLIEQNAVEALRIADRACVLERGVISRSGPAADLLRDDSVRRSYLGL